MNIFQQLCFCTNFDPADKVFFYQNLFHYVRRNSRLTADEMCGVSIGISCAYEVTNKLNWTIDIPESKKNKIFPNQKISSNKSFADEKIFYVGTIADIHIDLLYVPGAKSDCSEPVCCRPYHGISSQIEGMAGLWGTYAGCDTPLVTVHSTLQQLRNSEFNVSGNFAKIHSSEYNKLKI